MIPKRTGFFSLSLSPTALAHLLPLSLCAWHSDKSPVPPHPSQCPVQFHSATWMLWSGAEKMLKHCTSVLQPSDLSAAPECGCVYEIHFTFWLSKWMQPTRLYRLPWSRKTTWCAKPIIQQKSKEIDKRNYYANQSSIQSITGYAHKAVKLQHLWAPSMQFIHPSEARTLRDEMDNSKQFSKSQNHPKFVCLHLWTTTPHSPSF